MSLRPQMLEKTHEDLLWGILLTPSVEIVIYLLPTPEAFIKTNY